MKKNTRIFWVLCLNIFLLQILVEARTLRRIDVKKFETKYSLFLETSYYDLDKQKNEYFFDNADAELKFKNTNLNSIIAINYKNNRDTFFNNNQIFLNKFAAELPFNGFAVAVGKMDNMSMPRNYNYFDKMILTRSFIDNSIFKNNPFSAQLYTLNSDFFYAIGIFAAPKFTTAPIFETRTNRISSLALNYEDYDSKKIETFASIGISSKETGLFFKVGLSKSAITDEELDNLKIMSADNSLTGHSKKMWYAAISQKYQAMDFFGGYYKFDISNFENILYDVLLSYQIEKNFNLCAGYNKSKIKNVTTANKLFANNTQYIAGINYDFSGMTIGYEYLNHKNSFDSQKLSNHIFKVLFVF